MNRVLTPKIRRNIARILPFGAIWLVVGWIFLFTEMAATGYQNMQPNSAITLTLPVIIFASVAVALAGILVGAIEVLLLEKRFRNYSLTQKILYKLFTYLLIIFGILLLTYPIAASLELSTHLADPVVWEKMLRFFFSITFLSTVVQLSFQLLLSLFYAAISENVGHQVLLHFFTGKYHKPVIETRVFMFLDMKSSTTIAEKLGHVAYFDLLEMYYAAMSDPIIAHRGEVYQYIGDEVVVSWPFEAGIERANCLQCFFSIEKKMRDEQGKFLKKFKMFPEFRAGVHFGEVTTGEIGALKKEIVFTGDVLNTTSRIQGYCKEFGKDLLVSEALISHLGYQKRLSFQEMGMANLRGKTQAHKLFAVEQLLPIKG